MKTARTTLLKRFVVASPFAVACVLNLLSLLAYRFHWNPQHIASYGFLFAAPWGWLVDSFFVSIQNRWLFAVYGYAVLLWLPAALYSGCLWLLLNGIQVLAIRMKTNRERAR